MNEHLKEIQENANNWKKGINTLKKPKRNNNQKKTFNFLKYVRKIQAHSWRKQNCSRHENINWINMLKKTNKLREC